MAKIEVPPKIRTEDFSSDDQEIADKIGSVYNNFADQVYQQLTKGIDYENLKRQLVTLDVSTDAMGKVINAPNIRLTVPSRVIGTNVLNAINLVNLNIYPTSHPFISWTINGSFLVVLNVSGLQPNSQYRLTTEIIV